jgi:hypothetical protein
VFREYEKSDKIPIMKPLTWWLRIVGALYLVEGIGLSLAALLDPDAFAAIWASAPAGTLDAVAVRGIRIAGLPGVLTWGLPVDLVALFNGFGASRALTLGAIHVIIGVSGIMVLRRR